jgi:CYTH domain
MGEALMRPRPPTPGSAPACPLEPVLSPWKSDGDMGKYRPPLPGRCVIPMSEPREIEPKLEVPVENLPRLARSSLLKGAAPASKPANLVSVYFDTKKLKLRESGFSLRVRRTGRRLLQTVTRAPPGRRHDERRRAPVCGRGSARAPGPSSPASIFRRPDRLEGAGCCAVGRGATAVGCNPPRVLLATVLGSGCVSICARWPN